ncbi:hypothetical protein V5799_003381 [Amblyomma americanum]|uniref:Uncharacterized protein n=1 Tax=Amblyomma americanum TaxID=6943 RepID=A0AAQ4D957_AMBAM
MFSSTMGVMIFVGAEGSGKPTRQYEDCERAVMVDYDALCNTTVGSGPPSHDQYDQYAFKAWQHDNRSYWASYETEQSLTLKLDRYIANISDGWAIFEVQRDVGKACSLSDNIRVELIQAKARFGRP